MRTVIRECTHCREELVIERPRGSRGRLPKMHPHCSVESNRIKSREKQRKIRAGLHIPEWRPMAPLWDETDHQGPGSRKALTNAQGQGLVRMDLEGGYEEVDALDLLQRELTEQAPVNPNWVRGYGTPDTVRKGPVPTGHGEAVDAVVKALRGKDSAPGWDTSQGPYEGRTAPHIPAVRLDPEAREWIDGHPDWFAEEKPDHLGGWGVKPSPTPAARMPEPGDSWRHSVLGESVSLDDWPRPDRIHKVYDLNSTAEPVWPDARIRSIVMNERTPIAA